MNLWVRSPAEMSGKSPSGHVERDLGAVGDLAHNVVQHVGRQRRGPGLADLGRDRLGHLEIEVGGLEPDSLAFGPHQNVGQDRDRGTPFDHAMDVPERLEQGRAFESDFHGAVLRWLIDERLPEAGKGADICAR